MNLAILSYTDRGICEEKTNEFLAEQEIKPDQIAKVYFQHSNNLYIAFILYESK